MKKTYALLHCHSHNSLLDGMSKEEELIKRAKELGLHSIALTDHGNLFGAVPFYQAGQEHGVKTIVGCEVYICDDIKVRPEKRESLAHLILLVQNEKGWRNLLKLLAIANHPDHFYYKPRLDRNTLREHSQGLVALSACMAGELPKSLFTDLDSAFADLVDGKPPTTEYVEMFLKDDFFEFEKIAADYQSIFDGRFYLELQDAGLAAQKVINEVFRKMSPKIGIPCVASSDPHFPNPEDSELHHVLLCVQTNRIWDDRNSGEVFEFTCDPLQSYDEMAKKFSEEELARTVEIADSCNFDLPIGVLNAPQFEVPDNKDDMEFLTEIAEASLKERGLNKDQKYIDRLRHELGVIKKSNLASYMLIVWDVAKFCTDNDIPLMIRGSANGCLILWLIGVTDPILDPVKYGLYFERFYNIGRNVPPCISFGEWTYDQFLKSIGDEELSDDLWETTKEWFTKQLFHFMNNNAISEDLLARREKEYEFLMQNRYSAWYLFDMDKCGRKCSENCANSIVAYQAGITDKHPTGDGLKIIPGRIKLPDVDMDIASSQRDRVVSYVHDKYGEKNVAQISTFGTLKARMVIKDLYRVFNVGGGKTEAKEAAEKITKAMPHDPDITLEKALKMVPELQEEEKKYPKIWEMAKGLEGVKRQRSTHAAGLVIANQSLSDLIPLTYDSKLGLVTGLDMEDVEALGLIKYDFLGVNTLDVNKTCERLINASCGAKEIEVETVEQKPEIKTEEWVKNGSIETCKRCKLRGQLSPVVGAGTCANGVMIIGEAPGENEAKQGNPFVGRSGNVLNIMLQRVELKREECFISNICKCLNYSTIVKTEEGNKRIIDIVKQKWDGKALSVDPHTGKFCWKKINGWYSSKLGKRKAYKISFVNGKKNSKGDVGFIATNDHKILTKRGWVKVSELVNSDLVATGTPKFSDIQKSIMLGSLLGDGSLSKGGQFQESHGPKQLEYSKFKKNIWGNMCATIDIRKNNTSNLRLKRTLCIKDMRKNYYTNAGNKNFVEILKDIDVIGLAIWYLDDGYWRRKLNKNGNEVPKSACVEIAMGNIPKRQANIVPKILDQRFGIKSYVKKRENCWRLYLRYGDGPKFLKWIARFVPQCMSYKIPEEFAIDVGTFNYYKNKLFNCCDFQQTYWTKVKKKAIKPSSQTFYCIDIEDTHCFVTPGGVVHNCRPPNNRDPQKEEIEKCIPWLYQQIKELKPKVIVAVGRIAAQTLMDTTNGITKLEPEFIDKLGCHIIPMVHPSYILRKGMNKDLVDECVERLKLAKQKGSARNIDFD